MGFFAVLAASLFAVFLFTVFGGYSLLLWCQQSLLMVVPPAVVLAVLCLLYTSDAADEL